MNLSMHNRPMSQPRRNSGNLVVTVSVVFVILILAFFALNYSGILGAKKEAQTAADAAALYVATELTSITVPSRVGNVGLVDLGPKDPSNPFFRTVGANNQIPVIGFNTALATLRLDTLIANDLNNADMKYLAEQDRLELAKVGGKLKDAIIDRVKKDGPIFDKARDIYQQNNRRLGKGELDINKFFISVGRLEQVQGMTNCPIPVPSTGDDSAIANSTQGVYKYGVDIPIGGKSFVFAPIGDEPRLVPAGSFINVTDGRYDAGVFKDLPCAVVKIDAVDKVKQFIKQEKEEKTVDLQSIACAQAGSNRVKSRSTVYTLGFAGAFPSESVFPMLSIDALLKFNKWEDPTLKQTSTWLKNTSGKDYPGGLVGGVSLAETNFVAGRGKIESPSTALAYGLYDWLRSLRLRPNRDSIKAMVDTDDLRLLSEPRSYPFPQEEEDEQGGEDDDGDADELAEMQDEDDVPPVDAETSQDEEQANSGVPIQGCMVSLGGPTDPDPRFVALRDGTEDGAHAYFDSFNYKPIDEELCPESALAFLVDPITGAPKAQAGNSIIELCQLVEGTIATNRAALTARTAGREVIPDIQNARKTLFHDVNKNVNQAQTDLSQLENAEKSGDPAKIAERKAELAAQLRTLQAGLNTYEATRLVANSPLSNMGGNNSPLGRVDTFEALAITPDNAKSIANDYLSGSHNMDDVVKLERHRIQGIARRARRMRINGRVAMLKTVRLTRRLRRFSARGIRRIDAKTDAAGNGIASTDENGKKETFQIPTFEKKKFEVLNKKGKLVKRKGVVVSGHVDSGVPKPEFDLFPEAPSFVANIRRPGKSLLGAGHKGGPAAARVIHILPSNYPNIIRNNTSARPHFFKLDEVTRPELDEYEKTIEGLQTNGWEDKVVVPPGKELGTGNDFYPQNQKVQETHRRNWDTYGKANKNGFGPNTVVGRGTSGINYMRFYNKANVYGNDKTGKDKRIEPFFLKLKQLRQLIREAQLGSGLNEEDGNPDDFAPGFEQVFILSCDGDASFDHDKGTFKIDPINKASNSDPRYPFGTNSLLKDQFLYFNGSGLKEGPDAPGSDESGPLPSSHPLWVQRSVIARDQFADLSKGSSYMLQERLDWCKKSAPYDLEIGASDTGECAYPAGEFRIGIPISIACCKLNPDKLVINFRPKNFGQVVDLPDPFGDDTLAGKDKTLDAETSPEEDAEVCPPIVRRGAKQGRVFGFLN